MPEVSFTLSCQLIFICVEDVSHELAVPFGSDRRTEETWPHLLGTHFVGQGVGDCSRKPGAWITIEEFLGGKPYKYIYIYIYLWFVGDMLEFSSPGHSYWTMLANTFSLGMVPMIC